MGRLRSAGLRSSGKTAGSKLAGGSGGGYGDADVAKLKDAIQTLCQSTHPLGERALVCHEETRGIKGRMSPGVACSKQEGKFSMTFL